jgi:hypothetical protein
MKKLFAIVTVGFLVACSANQTAESSEESVVTPTSDSVAMTPANNEPEATESVEEIMLSAKLQCVDKGMDEYDVPHSDVFIEFGDHKEKVSSCLACQTITEEDFSKYDIPKDALSACGGWWAGGGDYFYVIRNARNTIEVYAGWQDEGQMEDNDTSFHWELKKTYE